ncbi:MULTISPECIES: phosphatidylglycerophosphatase A family protein [Nitrosomonas]|uniref:Phosphatidylglycerophosphatase A n=1 Tax=Nitrosomonas communis TaxID=44574 RepID=A0A0F7KF74_9PROT|nr:MULTISPECIES: phosphatidylglycerophosphatase A [Nitrosomonas]AKH37808.1 phosphatidylglycerophosphatase [Nitrosomonas communis]TYP84859.1 phosphatidylglycerophosphatase A [Nitrosomonas communis]UVS63153.1 phosphatidylglycerophosphatase A [Nitrosomonas sp. PLL12]
MTTSLPEPYQSDIKLPRLQPDLAFVHSRFAHFVAFGAGVGLIPWAPGTFGTLIAFPLFWSLNSWFEPITLLLVIDILFILGIWACSITGKVLGAPDHSGMVWDEIVAFMLVLYFIPDHVLWYSAAFILFRFFDILKPPPIKYFERKLHGGFGVMFDDLLAAFYTLLCLSGWKSLVLFESYF